MQLMRKFIFTKNNTKNTGESVGPGISTIEGVKLGRASVLPAFSVVNVSGFSEKGLNAGAEKQRGGCEPMVA